MSRGGIPDVEIEDRTDVDRDTDPERGHRTPPVGVVIPDYEEGFGAGRRRGIADTLEAFRLGLIEGGTPSDIAWEMAARLGRKVGVSGR